MFLQILEMKVLISLTLVSLALGGGDMEMIQKWQKMKAMESCWGEDNMNQYKVEAKKAVAKCYQQDAPELSLPPYRSSYRFVNTLLTKADEMEDMHEMFAKMMFAMRSNNQQNSFSPYSNDYQMSDNSNSDMVEVFSKLFNNNNKMDNYRTNYRKNDAMARMSQFVDMFKNSRSKREVSPDLGDRLVERLAEQKVEMEHKVGNMTCVLREMNYLNSRNEIDVRAMKQDMQKYNMPSEWFGERYEETIDNCYEMANNLPAEWSEASQVTSQEFGTIKLGEIKMFMKCCAKSKTKLCMNQDIKKKVETNFGPLEELLKETQLTETEFFPLVVQLLHGREMDFILGGEF